MRYFTYSAILAILCLFNQYPVAQDTDVMYVQVDYMKPLEGAEDDYVWMENMIYKPIHQERIQNGEIVAWYLYAVQFPRGADNEYDYVTLTMYANLSSVDESTVPYNEVIAKVHPDKTLAEVQAFAEQSRKLIKSEVYKSNARFPMIAEEPPRSLLIDYMKVPPISEALYTRMEKEIWMPLHKERYSQDLIVSWGLYELMFPGGANYPYTHATATGFASWDKITSSWPEGIWSDVHPSASQEELETRAHQTRDLVSSQIWKLADFTIRM